MANEWKDPDAGILGGLSKAQEKEVADQLERSLGLNPDHGWIRNTDNIIANVSKIYGMTDEDWDKMFRELPHYGEFQDQDIDAIQEHFLNKYPHKKILGIPIEFRSPWDWDTIGEKYGIEAGVIPSDAAYQKIMSISPDALSGVKTTGLDSYQGPIAETIEWKDVPKMANGGLINGTRGDPGMAVVGENGPEVVISNNAEVVPLSYQQWDDGAEEGYSRQDFIDVGPYKLESGTVTNLGMEPWYGDRALLEPNAASAFLEMEREYAGDIPIDSALRSVIHNQAVGGTDTMDPRGPAFDRKSKHLKGLSIDITDPVTRDWVTRYGSRYGWNLAIYRLPDGTMNTNHFNYTPPQTKPIPIVT